MHFDCTELKVDFVEGLLTIVREIASLSPPFKLSQNTKNIYLFANQNNKLGMENNDEKLNCGPKRWSVSLILQRVSTTENYGKRYRKVVVSHVNIISSAFCISLIKGRGIQSEIVTNHKLKSVKLNAHTRANAIINSSDIIGSVIPKGYFLLTVIHVLRFAFSGKCLPSEKANACVRACLKQ